MVSRGITCIAALLIFALLPALAHAQTEPPRGKTDLAVRGKTIDQRIAEFMAANDVPGLAMAIVQAPYIPRPPAMAVRAWRMTSSPRRGPCGRSGR
ncbi:MAG TPA: hypothetical protein VK630_09485 [Reyranella sp.]|nr:hypothetical protein [Reyranella sp.]